MTQPIHIISAGIGTIDCVTFSAREPRDAATLIHAHMVVTGLHSYVIIRGPHKVVIDTASLPMTCPAPDWFWQSMNMLFQADGLF